MEQKSFFFEPGKTKEQSRSGAFVPCDKKTFVHVRKGKIYELPDSGGTGPNSYTMAGLLLKDFSTVCLICKHKFAERRTLNSS